MTEPDVTLTDYLLAAECGLFAWLLRKSPSNLRASAILFFLFLGIASLAGGTVHGFFLDQSTYGYQILWRATLLAVGLVSFFSLVIGATLFDRRWEPPARILGLVGLASYTVYVILFDQRFLVAMLGYLPTTLVLFAAFVTRWRRGERAAVDGLVGLCITFGASAVQQARLAIHPTYFNHNALFHVLQAIALVFLYRAFRAPWTHTNARAAVLWSSGSTNS